jgi:VCBS repeat protein
MPVKFLGSDFQINADVGGGSNILLSQSLPQVMALSDGRFAVAYEADDPANTGGVQPIAAIYNADGSVSLSYLAAYTDAGSDPEPTLAALPGGGFGVVFVNPTHANHSPDALPRNITYVRVAANGTLGTPLSIGDFNGGLGHDDLSNPAIATLSTGRQVVVFQRSFSGTDNDVFLNVVSADGTTTLRDPASAFAVASSVAQQLLPAVAAAGNTAMIVYVDSTGATGNILNISANLFDGASNTLSVPFTIASRTNAFDPEIAALDDHRYVVVYDDLNNIFGRIYDTSGGGSLSAEFEIDQPTIGGILPAVAATADGGFIVTWYRFLNGNYDIVARRYNSDGVAMQSFTVNRLTDGDQVWPTVAVSGANAFFAWTDLTPRPGDPDPPSVRGQVMSLTTPPDFNDNGVSDILWRSASGGLVAWDMNRIGAIGGSGFVTYGGVVTAPDASYSIAAISDFSGDGKADVLWRNTAGSLIEWLMSGSVITQSSFVTAGGVPVNPDPSWSFLGAGDFNGDGMSDMLWRNASGEIAEWQVNGTVIAGSGDLNAGGGAVFLGGAWSVAGIGDFNGDGKADIIWRNASGEVAEWQMNGSTIIGSNDLTAGGVASAPTANWSVAGVGDFNADGNADLLWRDNSSGALVEWLMNGSSITGSGSVTSGGTPVNPDPSWHVVEIGDFNGDARADILWRNDSGALAEWFMKGTAIVGTATPTFGGAAVTPDGSWTVQAKPTDFA